MEDFINEHEVFQVTTIICNHQTNKPVYGTVLPLIEYDEVITDKEILDKNALKQYIKELISDKDLKHKDIKVGYTDILISTENYVPEIYLHYTKFVRIEGTARFVRI